MGRLEEVGRRQIDTAVSDALDTQTVTDRQTALGRGWARWSQAKALLERGSCVWLPNRDPMSYSA
jgi:hypothetical protein